MKGDNDTVFVKGISSEMTSNRLRDLFEDEGFSVESAHVPLPDRVTGHSRGFAFVKLKSYKDLEDCVKALDGKEVSGNRISCEVRQPTEAAKRYGEILSRGGARGDRYGGGGYGGRSGGDYGGRGGGDYGRGRRDRSRGRYGDRGGDRGDRRERDRSERGDRRRSRRSPRRSERRRTPKKSTRRSERRSERRTSKKEKRESRTRDRSTKKSNRRESGGRRKDSRRR